MTLRESMRNYQEEVTNKEHMDFSEREKAWQTKLDKVFNEGSGINTDCKFGDTSTLIIKYKELLNKRTRLWWNKAFMYKYLICGLIPRGLRIQVFPSFNINDSEFVNQWEDAASTCSRKYMELLSKYNEKQLNELDVEIGSIQDEVNKNLAGEMVAKVKVEVETFLKKCETEVVQRKTKKYQRDLTDRQQDRIYKWRYRQMNGNNNKNPIRGRSTSLSSVSSLEEPMNTSDGVRPLWDRRDHVRDRRWKNGKTNKRKMANSPKSDKKARTNTLEVINLSSHVLSDLHKSVLQLGLSFSPVNNFDYFTAVKDLHLFSRKIILRKLHSRPLSDQSLSVSEAEAIHTLEELESESHGDSSSLMEHRNF
ncbi:uncharacterized protein [Dendrobates tinctorius]|uniref:uncharacterized protein n=1 Tax=Dendrobates tinctorius TaxID=92724 RepID=UPI003CC9AE42